MVEMTRAEPPRRADERALLDAWIDYYRRLLVHKCAGLTAGQLVARSCPPSPMSLIGLVRHLTEMERAYAQRLAAPDLPLYYCTDDSPDGDFEDVTPTAALDDLRIHAEHCERSAEVMVGFALDDMFGRREPYSLRWVCLYLIKEYARHLGHADLSGNGLTASPASRGSIRTPVISDEQTFPTRTVRASEHRRLPR